MYIVKKESLNWDDDIISMRSDRDGKMLKSIPFPEKASSSELLETYKHFCSGYVCQCDEIAYLTLLIKKEADFASLKDAAIASLLTLPILKMGEFEEVVYKDDTDFSSYGEDDGKPSFSKAKIFKVEGREELYSFDMPPTFGFLACQKVNLSTLGLSFGKKITLGRVLVFERDSVCSDIIRISQNDFIVLQSAMNH